MTQAQSRTTSPASETNSSLSTQIVLQLFYPNASIHVPVDEPKTDSIPAQSTLAPFKTTKALSAAPFLSTYTGAATFLISADEFFEDNPLLASTLKPSTQQKYAIALENFRESQPAWDSDAMSLDQRLAIYIQQRFILDPRAGQRQEMANLVSMLLLMFPNLRSDIDIARRCITGWKTLKPARSAAPFTKQIVLAFAWYLLIKQRITSATIILTSYSARLRVSEALQLKWKDVALPGDIRLAAYGPRIAGLNIRDAKTSRHTGKLQFIKISDPEGFKYLETLDDLSTNQAKRIAKVSYQQYSTDLQEAAAEFGLQDKTFTSHSARIGKATEDYINGIPVEQIAINGRWKSINSLRYYLNNGRAWILNTQISQHNQKRIAQAAKQFREVIKSGFDMNESQLT